MRAWGWTPKIVARLNGQEVKLAKVQGEFAAKAMEADGTVLPEELDRLHALAHAVDQALAELRKELP